MTPAHQLETLYDGRFSKNATYRARVWDVLVREYFQQFVPRDARVLDLGCGYGQFINTIVAREKCAMDLNPRAAKLVEPGVTFFLSDCAERWPLDDGALDVVFTSNLLEHLADKAAVQRTLREAVRALAPGGTLICLGPNLHYLNGAYWDFWDHRVALTDRSLREILDLSGFRVERIVPRFLPYTMADGKQPPIALVRAYLRLPWAWPLIGRQFLIVARSSTRSTSFAPSE